jgi:hypothetical protein
MEDRETVTLKNLQEMLIILFFLCRLIATSRNTQKEEKDVKIYKVMEFHGLVSLKLKDVQQW